MPPVFQQTARPQQQTGLLAIGGIIVLLAIGIIYFKR
jgi:LPXTG-motif cell wall-anchored protein